MTKKRTRLRTPKTRPPSSPHSLAYNSLVEAFQKKGSYLTIEEVLVTFE